MLFSRIAALAALTMIPASMTAPAAAPVEAAAAPGELVDLVRWYEYVPPGAPFRIDMPMPMTASERDASGTKISSWKTKFGLMNIDISFFKRPGNAVFTPRRVQELMADGLKTNWKNPTSTITDVTVLGYPGAKLEIEHDVTGGRIRVERLLFRIGQDDWVIQTTRFTGRDGELDSAHIFRSIKAPAPAPVLTPATIGRMTIRGFGKPVVTVDKLAKDSPYAKWTTHAFDYQGKTKAWVYNIRMKAGAFDTAAFARLIADTVINQSNPKPRIFPFPETIGGFPGQLARGQAVTGDGEEAFRIVTVGDGAEGWAMLAAGPNSARTEALLKQMVESIQIGK